MTPQLHKADEVAMMLKIIAEYYPNSAERIEEHIAALEAELTRIKQNHGCARNQGSTQFCAEAVEARKDSERLDWLEDDSKCYWVQVQIQPDGGTVFSGQGKDLRKAIDKAIKAKEQVA